MDAETATVGDWLARLDAEGWTEPVSLTMWAAARAAASKVLSRRRQLDFDCDDLAQDVFVTARSTTSLRRFPPDVRLVAWCGGVAKNLIRRHARKPCGAVPILASRASPRPPRPTRLSPGEVAERMLLLTSPERAAIDAATEGLGQRAAARRRGVGRDAHREALKRARRRLESGVAPRSPDPRVWALPLALRRSGAGDVENATILLLHAVGWPTERIAVSVEKTRGAVSQRLHRFRCREAVEGP
jgi:DNA-directed RNA polymerase specialized sigma24 family protein